jgi:hypothetical protein
MLAVQERYNKLGLGSAAGAQFGRNIMRAISENVTERRVQNTGCSVVTVVSLMASVCSQVVYVISEISYKYMFREQITGKIGKLFQETGRCGRKYTMSLKRARAKKRLPVCDKQISYCYNKINKIMINTSV